LALLTDQQFEIGNGGWVMKKYLLSGITLLALAAMAPAQAADLATYNKAPAPIAAPLYNWTGFYVGANIGVGWTDNGWGTFGVGTSNNSGFLGGLQVGADYQFAPNWVVGIEALYDWTNNSSTAVFGPAAAPFTVSASLNGIGAITGRIGYTWGPGLLYFKGGWAWADSSLNLVAAPAGVPLFLTTNGNSNSGYTLGGGLEWMFAPHWSAKVEYDYYNFNSSTFTLTPALANLGVSESVNAVIVGVNYRF
jgi:outer membrane immunogenic protein